MNGTDETTVPLAEVRHLRVVFGSGERQTVAVDDVGMSIAPGEIVGVVGESGAGKSMLAYSLMGLIDFVGGRVEEGTISLAGRAETPVEWGQIRGRLVSMIFQEPMSSLNPLLKIGTQLREAMRDRRGGWRQRAVELLEAVQIHDAERRIDQYPHEFSGGMRQRVMIAMALAQNAQLLIADEPTTALDATVQKEIVEVIRRLRDETALAVLFISHDIALVGEISDRTLVMYGGKIFEEGPTVEVLNSPRHPYTRLLLRSRPPDADRSELEKAPRDRQRLVEMPGSLQPTDNAVKLCRFLDRCPVRQPACETTPPPIRGNASHRVLCHAAT